MHFFLRSLVTLLLLSACTSDLCRDDSDCAGTVCVGATESDPGHCGRACTTTADCRSDETCRGVCVPAGTRLEGEPCDWATTCAHGLDCVAYDPTSLETTCHRECSTARGFIDTLCDPGEFCRAAPAPTCAIPCAVEGPYACAAGSACVNGECRDEEGLRHCLDTTCAVGMVCIWPNGVTAECITLEEAVGRYPRPTTEEFYTR